MSKAFIDSKMATLQIFANQNYRLLEVDLARLEAKNKHSATF